MGTKLSGFEKMSERETYGGGDGRAINKHSIRVYEVKGKRFTLDRTLDGAPPSFNLYYFRPGSFVSTNIKVDGKEYWGDGLSWPKAESKAHEAIMRHLSAA